MTQYANKSFTVPTAGRDAGDCSHGWRMANGKCVFCGEVEPVDTAAFDQAIRDHAALFPVNYGILANLPTD